MNKYLQIEYLWFLLLGLFTVTLSGCDDPLVESMDPVIDTILDDSTHADFTPQMSDVQPCLTVANPPNLSGDPRQALARDLGNLVSHAVVLEAYVWDLEVSGSNNEQVLTVAFLDGTGEERALVKQVAPEWSKHGNFRFDFVEGRSANIRVGFDPNGGHWSVIGNGALSEEYRGKKTMNLALRGEPPRRANRVILHEFGHALGLGHEHQNPAISIQWDEAGIKRDVKEWGWTDEDIKDNILTPLNRNQTNFTRFDLDSIMVYAIPNSWTIGDFETDYNFELSAMDKAFIGRIYGRRLPSPPRHMVLIPAGEFRMGSNDGSPSETPVHTVYVDEFYMDKYEVTNAQYKAFVNANPEWRKGGIADRFHNGDYLQLWSGNNYPNGKGNHPVVYVSWYAAMAYAEWAGKRLPTEAEWEKAARGGLSGLKYPWGNSIDSSRANYDRHIGGTTAVGTYAANRYGLFDMSGNVWEWCLDEYNEGFYGISPARNPLSSANSMQWLLDNYTEAKNVSPVRGVSRAGRTRVLRGGDWSNYHFLVRVSNRLTTALSAATDYIGFRCVRSVTP